jgi:hypothetical protein
MCRRADVPSTCGSKEASVEMGIERAEDVQEGPHITNQFAWGTRTRDSVDNGGHPA